MATAEIAEEIGDALFTLVNLGRHLQVDAEDALRAANAQIRGPLPSHGSPGREAAGSQLERARSPAQWDALWLEAKARP